MSRRRKRNLQQATPRRDYYLLPRNAKVVKKLCTRPEHGDQGWFICVNPECEKKTIYARKICYFRQKTCRHCRGPLCAGCRETYPFKPHWLCSSCDALID